MSKLVVVQCVKKKIWSKKPELGAVSAKDAYTSDYFRKNRAYAEKLGDAWVILSAKYGFLDPKDPINNYNVSFKKKYDQAISFEELRWQVEKKGLSRFDKIIVLGGKEYLEAVQAAFKNTGCEVSSPFRGLLIGQRMAGVNALLGK